MTVRWVLASLLGLSPWGVLFAIWRGWVPGWASVPLVVVLGVVLMLVWRGRRRSPRAWTRG